MNPSPQEIVVRKRLRLCCEFFAELNNGADVAEYLEIGDGAEDRNFLPPAVVEAIRRYETANLNPGDLMAIRGTPYKWARSDPSKWLWILHRYTNRYSAADFSRSHLWYQD